MPKAGLDLNSFLSWCTRPVTGYTDWYYSPPRVLLLLKYSASSLTSVPYCDPLKILLASSSSFDPKQN